MTEITEFDEYSFRLIAGDLVEVLSDEDLDRLRVPVFGDILRIEETLHISKKVRFWNICKSKHAPVLPWNQEKLHGGAVRPEANLPGTYPQYLRNFFLQMRIGKQLPLKMKVYVTEYNIRDDVIRWRDLKSFRVVSLFFAKAPIISEKSLINFSLENKCQSHRVQDARWCYSMTYMNVNNSYRTHFYIAHIISEILTLQNCDFDNLGEDRRVQHSHWRHSIANIIVYDSTIKHFSTILTFSDDINVSKFWTWKFRSRPRGRKTVLKPLDCKCSNLWVFLEFQLYSNIRLRAKVPNTHTLIV